MTALDSMRAQETGIVAAIDALAAAYRRLGTDALDASLARLHAEQAAALDRYRSAGAEAIASTAKFCADARDLRSALEEELYGPPAALPAAPAEAKAATPEPPVTLEQAAAAYDDIVAVVRDAAKADPPAPEAAVEDVPAAVTPGQARFVLAAVAEAALVREVLDGIDAGEFTEEVTEQPLPEPIAAFARAALAPAENGARPKKRRRK